MNAVLPWVCQEEGLKEAISCFFCCFFPHTQQNVEQKLGKSFHHSPTFVFLLVTGKAVIMKVEVAGFHLERCFGGPLGSAGVIHLRRFHVSC